MVTRGRDGVVGNKITYFKALSYSDVGVIGVESNSVSFRTFQTSRHFRLRFTLSSIIINWEGSYSSIKADWGDTSVFGRLPTLSGITENYMVAGIYR
jgi:hypothetical protein